MYWTDRGKKYGKSLDTEDRIEAEVKEREENKKRKAGADGSVVEGVRWDTFKEEFLKEYKDATLVNHKNTIRLFERFCKPTTISSLTYRDAKKFKTSLMSAVSEKTKKPFSSTYINIQIKNIHCAFEEALKMGYVTSNIFSQVKQIDVTERVPRYLTIDQVKTLKKAARNSKHPDLYLMTLIFLHTGVRKQELLNLKVSSFDLSKGIMFLHGSETWDPKERQEHAIGLHKDVAGELRKHLQKRRGETSPYLFPGRVPGRPRHKDAFGSLYNRLLKRAGIPYTGCHIARHTFATHYQGREKTKQRILGHKDPRTTQRYSHITPEELREVRGFNYGEK